MADSRSSFDNFSVSKYLESISINSLFSSLSRFSLELECSLDDQVEYLKEWLPTQQIKNIDNLNDFLYTESLNALAEDFLVRNDKLGMAHSLEGRFPILNKRLRDYVRAIPSHLKIDERFFKRPKEYHKRLQILSSVKWVGDLPKEIDMCSKTGAIIDSGRFPWVTIFRFFTT